MSKVAELVATCGPAMDARDLTAEQLTRAITEVRAMGIWTDRAMGSQEAGLSTIIVPGGLPPAVVFARPIPNELRAVAEPDWQDQDDIRRALDIPISPPFRRRR